MNIPEELLPVVEWWEKDGKQTVAILLVAGLAVAGYYGVKGWRESRRIAAADSLMTAYTAEDMEEAVANFGSTQSGASLKMRLAKKYFDTERYQEALDVYTALEGSAPDGFEDVPSVGKAQCLEALGKFDEALQAYDAFAEAKPKSFLALTAQLGAARSIAASGDKAKALEKLEALKTSLEGDDTAVSRVEATIGLVKRWEKREAKSLFDAADAAAKQLDAEAPKAEEPKAEAPKAEEPKAEEPKVEAPKAEEPKAEEPKTEEPKAEAPKAA